MASFFENIDDPRIKNRSIHKLIDIIVISVLGTLCGANSFYDLASFAESKEDFLKKFLELPGGVPSHDTFLRVLSLIRPKELESAFLYWMKSIREEVSGDVLCIDGKISRGTIATSLGQQGSKLTTVSVYSTESQLVLAQSKSSGTGNCETKTAQELLDLLNIKDQIIVCDAGVGSIGVAKKVIAGEGDYLFPIKKNRRLVYNILNKFFSNEKNKRNQNISTVEISEKSHGRDEKRILRAIEIRHLPSKLIYEKTGEELFKSAFIVGEICYHSTEKETRPFVAVKSETVAGKKVEYLRRDLQKNSSNKRTKEETRYFITSLNRKAGDLATIIRKQWLIENQLHWVLDVSFEEDQNRTRDITVANNLSTIRKIAFNIIKSIPSTKSIKSRIKRAGWDDKYLEELIKNSTPT